MFGFAPLLLLAASGLAFPVAEREALSAGRYIVTLKDGVDTQAHIQSLSPGSQIKYNYEIFNGFAGTFNAEDLASLKARDDVKSIEEDQIATIMTTENNNPWGLQRISQKASLANGDANALNYTYTFTSGGDGVDVYLVDTGIDISHPAFEGRAFWGATFGGYPDKDENGHGTHTAGTAISNPYGVAQSAHAIAVRVIDATGNGNTSDIIAGLQWVGQQAAVSGRGSVVSMSLGLPTGTSEAWDNAVVNLTSSGITVVIAAGNSAADAGNYSPARVPSAITVGASDITDTIAYFSNFGSVVDVFAPGLDVISTWNNGSTNIDSGTSMATPHVAGFVATLLSGNTGATPDDISNQVKALALQSVLKSIPAGTTNALLNNGNAQ